MTTTINTDDARLEAVLSLRAIAGWYFKSAEQAANPEARLWLAAKLEKEAARLRRHPISAQTLSARAAQ
jgi:hypothetical protein